MCRLLNKLFAMKKRSSDEMFPTRVPFANFAVPSDQNKLLPVDKSTPSKVIPPIPNFTSIKDCANILESVLECTEVSELGMGGAFGTVYQVKTSSPMFANQFGSKPPNVVIKCFRFGKEWQNDRETKNRNRVFENEVDVFEKIKSAPSHPHIVDYYCHFRVYFNEKTLNYVINHWIETDDHLFSPSNHYLLSGIVLEPLECTLAHWVISEKKLKMLNEELIHSVFYQIGDAIVYLHRDLLIHHADLKWDNILVSKVNADGTVKLKLIGFGNSRSHYKHEFIAAEKHSACHNLNNGEIVDLSNNPNIIPESEQNSFLEESYKFSRMIIMHTVVDWTTRWTRPHQPTDQELRTMFETIHMKEVQLKKVLLQMFQTQNYERVSLNYVWNYLHA